MELVWAQKSYVETSDDLAAILTADTEERRIGAEHRTRKPQPSYQIPLIARSVERWPGGNDTAALLSCCDLGRIYRGFFFDLSAQERASSTI